MGSQPSITTPRSGIAQACYGIWFYILKTVLPLDLIALYPLPRELNWLAPPFMLSILATLAITAGLFLLRRRWPGLLAAWLSYLVILAPNSGIIRISDQIAADRYSYMAMLGSVMVAAAGFCRLWQMSSRSRPAAMGIIAIGLAVLLGLILMTRNQCRTWLDSKTLWTHALTHWAGSNSVAHYNLGHYLFRRGNIEAATAHYTEALRLNPGDVDVHNNLGVVLARQGKYEEAAAQYAEALRLDPTYVAAHYNLGVALSRQGKDAEAAAQYAEALRLDPGSVDAHYNLGVVLSRRGSMRRRRLITSRPYGSIPASPMHTTTWEPTSHVRGGSPRRRLTTPRRCGSIPTASIHTPTSESSSPARGSSTRPRLIMPRPCGSILATRRRGITWKPTARARGSSRSPVAH